MSSGLFLSRLRLNLRDRNVMTDLGNAHGLHQRVMSLFPEVADGGRAALGVLFRVEDVGDRPLDLLVQSRCSPNFHGLPDGYLRAEPDSSSVTRLEPLLDSIQAGMPLRFRLRANATKKIPAVTAVGTQRKNGTRVPLKSEEELLHWLLRQGERWGFEPSGSPGARSIRVTLESTRVGLKRGHGKLTLASTLFEGMLVARDPEGLRAAILAGLGPAKAYGFGLLSVAFTD